MPTSSTFAHSVTDLKPCCVPTLPRCGSKQGEEDYRPLFENFVQDLLSTVNKPEWPAAELLLSLLGRLLVRLAAPELPLYYWTWSPDGLFQLSTLSNCGCPIGLDGVLIFFFFAVIH